MTAFEKKVNDLLASIPEEDLLYEKEEEWTYRDIYEKIRTYAYQKELLCTVLALEAARALLQGLYGGKTLSKDGHVYDMPLYYHSLFTCEMLMNLHPVLQEGEEDILLASALCRDILPYINLPEEGNELAEIYHLDYCIVDIVRLLDDSQCDTEEEMEVRYGMVRDHKLAFLVEIAWRSHMMEQLSAFSVGKAHEYIFSTRNYYFSMCIYAREKYHELESTIIIFQEKMHDLMEVAEIFVERYEKRVRELNLQIVAWEDDNYRLRTRLRKAGIPIDSTISQDLYR